MKKYIREENKTLKFSLHDSRIINFQFDYHKNSPILTPENGFVDINKDKIVEGNIVIEDVSIEDSCVYLMDYKNVLCGNVGSFYGEK